MILSFGFTTKVYRSIRLHPDLFETPNLKSVENLCIDAGRFPPHLMKTIHPKRSSVPQSLSPLVPQSLSPLVPKLKRQPRLRFNLRRGRGVPARFADPRIDLVFAANGFDQFADALAVFG